MKAIETLPKYTPRWLYKFFAFIERLPIPAWLLGLLYILVSAGALHWVAWSQSVVPFGEASVFLFSVGIFTVAGFVPWHFLSLRARSAIQDFFKSRRKSPAQTEIILSDFVSLPPLWGTVAFLLGGLYGIISYYQYAVPKIPLSIQVLPGWILVNYIIPMGFFSIIITRLGRQTVIMRHLYREMDVDIFNPAPIYALSRYAVVTTITLLLVIYSLVLLSLPERLLTTTDFISIVLVNGLLLLFFFAQLLGINQRMRQAKTRLLSQLSKDIESVYNDVHKAVQKKAYSAVGRMQASVVTLKHEQEILQKLPTWPWQPETLRNLLTPMLIPVIIYLMQRYLGGLFGI